MKLFKRSPIFFVQALDEAERRKYQELDNQKDKREAWIKGRDLLKRNEHYNMSDLQFTKPGDEEGAKQEGEVMEAAKEEDAKVESMEGAKDETKEDAKPKDVPQSVLNERQMIMRFNRYHSGLGRFMESAALTAADATSERAKNIVGEGKDKYGKKFEGEWLL